ncbi:hypothetical protein, partial [Staphylococcus gallinarum]|uniref:hypothetical protein n=1 Tax=Staphylococcus gallinarum TaxID=1293 RepID=UPI00316B56D4
MYFVGVALLWADGHPKEIVQNEVEGFYSMSGSISESWIHIHVRDVVVRETLLHMNMCVTVIHGTKSKEMGKGH